MAWHYGKENSDFVQPVGLLPELFDRLLEHQLRMAVTLDSKLALATFLRLHSHVIWGWHFILFSLFTYCTPFSLLSKETRYFCYQEYMRTIVGNSILWGLSWQNSKFVIDDAQPLSFQIVMHSPLNTCMLARSRSSIFLTGISGWACTLHARVRQSTVFNVGLNARG